MLDPYAPVATRVYLPNGVNVPPPKKELTSSDSTSNPPALMGCLTSLVPALESQRSQMKGPKTPLAETLVIELDVPSLPGKGDSLHKGGFYNKLICKEPPVPPLLRSPLLPVPFISPKHLVVHLLHLHAPWEPFSCMPGL